MLPATMNVSAPPPYFGGYRCIEEVGRGGQGVVFACCRGSEAGTSGDAAEPVALKAIDLRHVALEGGSLGRERLRREVDILRELPRHPNIVQLHEAFHEGNWLCIVMELVTGGSLYNVLITREPQKHFLPVEALHVLEQLVSGLEFLHMRNVIHRDLKLPNILVAAEARVEDTSRYEVKVSDFGCATAIGVTSPDARTKLSSGSYTAPEIVRGKGHPYDTKVDLWSLGVVLYRLLTLGFPHEDSAKVRQKDLDHAVARLTFAAPIKAVLSGLLQLKASHRLSLWELRNHASLVNPVLPVVAKDDAREAAQRSDGSEAIEAGRIAKVGSSEVSDGAERAVMTESQAVALAVLEEAELTDAVEAAGSASSGVSDGGDDSAEEVVMKESQEVALAVLEAAELADAVEAARAREVADAAELAEAEGVAADAEDAEFRMARRRRLF